MMVFGSLRPNRQGRRHIALDALVDDAAFVVGIGVAFVIVVVDVASQFVPPAVV